MNITTNDFQELFFNNVEVDKLEFNGDVVWEKPSPAVFYGVEWTTTSGTEDNNAMTRIGASANFADPNPYYSGMVGTPSSPFDNIAPWSGMEIVTMDGNSMVKIPKFYYKVEKDAQTGKITIMISPTEISGFHISPAHDRWNSTPVDYVYVGRYHCNSSYKSTTNSTPLTNKTRAEFRTGMRALGLNYFQFDYRMWVTIQLLYLVEFANWNSQAVIGWGGGNGSSVQATGASDSMPYHTGTMQTARDANGVGVQYRYIEDLWGNVYDYVDGITYHQADVYSFAMPQGYSDDYTSEEAILVGTRPTTSNWIQDISFSTVSGFDWLWSPASVARNRQNNISDNYEYSGGGVVLYTGGNYTRYAGHGLFNYGSIYGASNISTVNGSRLIYVSQSI